MKAVLTLLILSINVIFVSAQSIKQIKADRNTYIWGEGTGTTLKKANSDALAMIIGQISTEVESNFTLLKTEDLKSKADKFFSSQCK